MRDERSSGAVIFSIDKNAGAEFLLLHHTLGHWDFPKGNIEIGENEIQAAKREILEETGIRDVNFLEGFRKKIEYRYKRGEKLIHKEVIFYLLRANTRKIILSNEHIAYVWNKYDSAIKKLTYENTKNVLTEAKKFLETNSEKL
ncbi:MAG TPA: NUDIX domain-containing protein [Nitrososphaeraceae archaeon]|nr:NUDIX domain-containing protein [Nitrososphaeraceae archaeon]